jgi:hypothetical protein
MEGTFKKKIIGNELYLFNEKGELIFKRWINNNYSKVFTPFAYGKNDSYMSITEKDGEIIREKND